MPTRLDELAEELRRASSAREAARARWDAAVKAVNAAESGYCDACMAISAAREAVVKAAEEVDDAD